MSCCEKLKIAGRIAQGSALLTINKLFGLPKNQSTFASTRKAVCDQCPNQTWMTKIHYFAWLRANNIRILRHLDRLQDLPPLPIYAHNPGLDEFCAICKCWLPAKTFVKNEYCPLKKWET